MLKIYSADVTNGEIGEVLCIGAEDWKGDVFGYVEFYEECEVYGRDRHMSLDVSDIRKNPEIHAAYECALRDGDGNAVKYFFAA